MQLQLVDSDFFYLFFVLAFPVFHNGKRAFISIRNMTSRYFINVRVKSSKGYLHLNFFLKIKIYKVQK